jgi:hypothetical protein
MDAENVNILGRWQITKRRLTLTLRFAGIILPVLATYVLLFSRGLKGSTLIPAAIASAAIWLLFSLVLYIRHDRNGLSSITIFYFILNGWIYIFLFSPGLLKK